MPFNLKNIWIENERHNVRNKYGKNVLNLAFLKVPNIAFSS